MPGTQVTLEYLPTDNFGLELSYSLLPLGRTYQLGPQGATSQNVTEQASYGAFGANIYLFREERTGLHPVVGIAAGSVTVSQKFEGGTLGSFSTTNSVGINVAKVGLDWVINKAGFRLRFEQWTGEATSAAKIPGIRQTNSYGGSVASLGVFSFF
jgi:outer membrane protein W